MKEKENIVTPTEKEKLTEKAFKHSLAVSVIGILLCMAALCSTTWAWFTASRSSGVASIRSAQFTVQVTAVKDTDAKDSVEAGVENGIYSISLEAGNYTVTITATGTATEGYCVVSLGGTTYYTGQIDRSNSFEFKVTAHEAVTLKIVPHWGACSDEKRIPSDDALVYGTAQAPADPAPEPSDENAETPQNSD